MLKTQVCLCFFLSPFSPLLYYSISIFGIQIFPWITNFLYNFKTMSMVSIKYDTYDDFLYKKTTAHLIFRYTYLVLDDQEEVGSLLMNPKWLMRQHPSPLLASCSLNCLSVSFSHQLFALHPTSRKHIATANQRILNTLKAKHIDIYLSPDLLLL